MAHTCHATDCKLSVPPKMFMCRRHWFMLPGHMRRQVWEEYVPGQEITKTPTSGYLDIAHRCIKYIEDQEKV